jgi:ABC-2 type transport system ATP-binding protein
MLTSDTGEKEAIVCEDLAKRYGEVKAVDGVSFKVRRGEIFGFLGLNGAGKSTTIKMLSTLISPTSGSAKVLGYDITKDSFEIRKRIGVVQQQESYDRNLNVGASLQLYASLWGIERDEASKRIDFLLEKFGLKDKVDRKIRWLSYGLRRRLQVAREFLHDADLFILDEPTVGMDVLARHTFLEYCKLRAADGETIFYTTHVVSEAEQICDRVAVIHHGKIIALDSPEELKKKYTDVRGVSVVLSNNSSLSRLSSALEGMKDISGKEILSETNEIRIVSQDPFKVIHDISSLIESDNYGVESISVTAPSLEEVIVRLVGDSPLEREGGSGK